MNSTYQIVEQQLYQIIASKSRVPMQQWGMYTPKQNTTIIVFEKEDLENIYLLGYDSLSSNVILVAHHAKSQFTENPTLYYEHTRQFLTSILFMNNEAMILYMNFGEFIESQTKLEQAKSLLDIQTPLSKIIIRIRGYYDEIQNLQENILLTRVSFNQFALLKVDERILQQIRRYQQYTYQQLNQYDNVHELFILFLEENEKQVVLFNFYNLIKSITKQQDLPNLIPYHAVLMINLSKFTQQQPTSFIPLLREYRSEITQVVEKVKMKDIIEILPAELALFKEEKYCHFPMKSANSQKCKVCQKNQNQKVRKSTFKCEGCFKYYKMNITLCTVSCFKQFHLNPGFYLKRKSRKSKVKEE